MAVAVSSVFRALCWQSLGALWALQASAQTAVDGAASAPQAQRIEIIGTLPTGGEQPRARVPSNVQHVNARQLREWAPLNLPELMARHLGSVNVNETQGNPYLIEVNFRGFSASSLLGTPQGLSVYVDGVRVNEPFGDVVNWDLIPRNAMASVTLMPGSNPVFGLNTLGGAVAVRTKRGDEDPGTQAEIGLGSFGRRNAQAAYGSAWGDAGHLFVAATAFDERGWRDASPSRLHQAFARAGQRLGSFEWDASLTAARSNLFGNGPLPEDMLASNRRQVYTLPDQTRNDLLATTLHAHWALSASDKFSATLYRRNLRARGLNGDLNDEYAPPDETDTGVENRSRLRQRGTGLAVQWARRHAQRQTTLGAAWDHAATRFTQTQAEGQLDAGRAVTEVAPAEVNALIHGSTRTASLYGALNHEVVAGLDVTLAVRWNDTRVVTVDEGRESLGLATTLDGQGRYRRLNPAAGATWQITPALTLYGGVSQGNRAPSPIELGCSNPEQPCVLPNALQSDPPLQQVIARTGEFGLRGVQGVWRWNAGLFRTVNRNDILFISNQRAAGYFQNVGQTRRQGLEAGVHSTWSGFEFGLNYSLVDARYRSPACLVAEGNSSAETSAACPGDDEIEVRPGDRLPGVARHNLKLDAAWRPADAWRLALNVAAHSGSFIRGNENNQHAPDGGEFSGSGRVAGYALLNLSADWTPTPGWTVALKLSNALDRRVATGGLLAETAFTPQGVLLPPAEWRQAQFVAPGAGRAVALTLRLDLP